MKTAFKLIFYIVSLIFLLLALAAIAMVYLNEKITQPANFKGQAKVIEVKQGQGAKEIAQNLYREGIISNDIYFLIYLWEIGQSSRLKAGKYSIGPSMSIKDIAGTMISGNVLRNEVQVTVPEGFNLSEIEKRLAENDILKDVLKIDDLINFNYDSSPKIFDKHYDFLKIDCKGHYCGLEGYLFPDTYNFSTVNLSLDRDDVVIKFLDNFDKKTKLLRDEMKTRGSAFITDFYNWPPKPRKMDFNDIVIMASIIEKEVQTPSDMKMVSGVLWKRISIGMPLQVDAPIVYITGKKAGEITLDDLKIDSPYNTYLHKGLPPAPISNPGLNAIDAALNPAQNDYLYYLSKPTGETVFSKTLGEHNKAKNLYLK